MLERSVTIITPLMEMAVHPLVRKKQDGTVQDLALIPVRSLNYAITLRLRNLLSNVMMGTSYLVTVVQTNVRSNKVINALKQVLQFVRQNVQTESLPELKNVMMGM